MVEFKKYVETESERGEQELVGFLNRFWEKCIWNKIEWQPGSVALFRRSKLLFTVSLRR